MIILLTSCGPELVTFKAYFKPNKVYRTALTTLYETEVDISGNQDKIEKMKAGGAKFPQITSSYSEITNTATTGRFSDGVNVPTRIVYGNVTTHRKLNDMEIRDENSMSGLVIEGFYTIENKLVIDTMISDTMDEKAKKLFRSTLQSAQQQIEFPENPMKKGGRFQQTLPMEIPIPGLRPVKVAITTSYKLADIKGNIATFDISQAVAIGISNEQTNVSVTGNGIGVSEFDVVNNIVTKRGTDLTITAKFAGKDITINAWIKSKIKELVTVE